MKKNIHDIIEEITTIDPDLKEKDLETIITRFENNKPDIYPDKKFKEELKIKLQKKKRVPIWRIVTIAAGVFSAAVAAIIIFPFLGSADKDAAENGMVFGDIVTVNTPRATENQTLDKTRSATSVITGYTNEQKEVTIGKSTDIWFIPDGKPGEEGEVPPSFDKLSQLDANTEGYQRIYENPFLKTISNPLSTFSIDVDTASYANTRRFLQSGSLPYPDAVRIEELVNYFSYEYPQPVGEHPFSITTELSSAPWNKEHKLLLIGLQGKHIQTENLPPSNLVFLLDVSGSMNSEDKLPLLKQAMKLLVEQMRTKDNIAIVVYAGAAGLVLPATSGDNKTAIMAAIDDLSAGGSTAGGAGIKLAYDVAQKQFIQGGNNRVILATDGDFNVGASSDSELVRLIEEKRKSGVFLSVLGFGTGNLKDSKMEQLADKGNGNYAYIDSFLEAKKVLGTEMGGTLFTIAKDVKLQIEFNPTKVKEYRLLGYENRILAKEDFDDDTKDAGELGSGHSVTALYEIIPQDGAVKNEDLRYQDSTVKPDAGRYNELCLVKFRYKKPDSDTSRLIEQPVISESKDLAQTSNNFRFASSVVMWGLLLRDSEYKGAATYDMTLYQARDARGRDEHGYRNEFLRLVETSRDLDKR